MAGGRDSVAILVPVLGRPHRVEPLVESIESATSPPFRVVFATSPGDQAEVAAIDAVGAGRPWVGSVEVDGNYATKINAAIALTDDPLLFTGADDLDFHPGWLEAALRRLGPTAAVVGTQDLCNPAVLAGEHATHFLVTREYVDLFGTIDERDKLLHESYPHEWVDNELIETARYRRLYEFAPDSVVEHLHPIGGKAPPDSLYDAREARTDEGRPIFEARRRLWSREP